MTVYSSITWAISLGKVFISISSVNLRGDMSTTDQTGVGNQDESKIRTTDYTHCCLEVAY